MNKKRVLLEIGIVIAAFIYCMITVTIPDYRKEIGSSDSFINSSKVENIIEIRIDNQTDFAVILSKSNEIYHIFFFDNQSTCLYNNGIESLQLENGIEKIITLLIENNLLNNNSTIEIIRTNDKQYKSFISNWNKYIRNNSITLTIEEEKENIEVKAEQLGINTESYSSMLWELDLYSKEIIKNYQKEEKAIDETKAIEYANNVYLKLDQLAKNHSADDIPITLIPADENHSIYPTDNSWYRIEDENVYAYIEIKEKSVLYSYCYKGSIDNRVKGKCQE